MRTNHQESPDIEAGEPEYLAEIQARIEIGHELSDEEIDFLAAEHDDMVARGEVEADRRAAVQEEQEGRAA